MSDTLESKLRFEVIVDDNGHYQDKEWRSLHGTYNTYEQALSEAHGIVDTFLREEHKLGMTAKELYQLYQGEGPDPFIIPTPESITHFSAWDYAQGRCDEICKPK